MTPRKWKKFKRALENYSLETELSKKSDEIQVATLTVIEVNVTFTDCANADDKTKIN